ncbi:MULTISPECIES: type II toxin-antitoxin system Phd/YefM family antitoxin [unclassified Mesorhizobium]|uniref:type II toxin-antitoxin system Phd/YefM family antitoxin n=1 Tax=unclassified Mesorhizobium TaxID=325217 RepID=UPI0011267238|nr:MULTISPECIES: type II toxin-antitoxin system Phd/YefM family antitoxin [unclassified Mesorhizobium]TPK89326.1 type II toxin-antitoxin system Phd/YefM family antitoxin [Mesorhizobium sp. B2-4-16]TPL70721.1 type II toxin-antitoxin system Phd/YefM family antitoxin [Mesorhizobium sp. B2-4-3]
MNWHLKDARNNFSKVVQRARTKGPQTVTIRGERAAVILSAEDYDRLIGQKKSLVEYLMTGPGWDDSFDKEINNRSDT